MMLTASMFRGYLLQQFPSIKFYAGALNREEKCVGVYPKSRQPYKIALGGVGNTSHWSLPITLLVHWGENTSECELQAIALYEHLLKAANTTTINGVRVIDFDLLDSCPIDLVRDDKNICEMVIRLNIIYENQIN